MKKTSKILLVVMLAGLCILPGCGMMRTLSAISRERTVREQEMEELQSCTVGDITFYVDADWVSDEEYEGAFWNTKMNTAYMLQGVSALGSYTAEDFFQELKEHYALGYEITYVDEELSELTANDSYVGRIEMIQNGIFYVIDVVVFPQKNLVLTFAAQCREGNVPSVDIRKISETAEIQIGTEDYISGRTFQLDDRAELILRQDGSCEYYPFAEQKEDNYGKGTYEVYYGQSAFDKLVSMTEYGITEEELEPVHKEAQNGYTPMAASVEYPNSKNKYTPSGYHVCTDTFYVVILHMDELVQDGKDSGIAGDVPYFGYYLPELDMADMLNANNANYIAWKGIE